MTATSTRPLARPRPATGTMTMSLDEVTDQVVSQPDNFLVYGPPGSGKTSLACEFPSPVFLMTDDGLLALMRAGIVGKTSYFPKAAETAADVRSAVNELVVKDHPHKTLVIDTVTGVEALFAEETCQSKYGNSREKFDAFGGNSGYKSMMPTWADFLDSLSRLRDRKGVGAVLLAHSYVRNEKNPEGADYGKFAPSLHRVTAERTVAWADAVLFYTYETFVVDVGKGPVAKQVARGNRRVLRCVPDAAYEAKNRLGLPDVIDCSKGPKAAYEALSSERRKAEGSVAA